MNLLIEGVTALGIGVCFLLWALWTVFYYSETKKVGKSGERFLFSLGGIFFLIVGVGSSMHFYMFDDPADYDLLLIITYTISALMMYMILMYGLTKLALMGQAESRREKYYYLVAGAIATILSLTLLASFISAPFVGYPKIIHK